MNDRAAIQRRVKRAASLLLGMALATPSTVLACPSCKAAVEGDPVGTALSWTTLVMIAAPLLLFGSIGGWVSYMYWRASRRPEAPALTPLWLGEESES